MNEQKKNFNYEYFIGFVISFILFFLINEENDNGIFGISAIVLIINLFLFIRARYKVINSSTNLIISSLALTTSIWIFFHCLFLKYTTSQEFIIWITRHNKGMAVFNCGAFSFFMAALVLFVDSIIEALQKKKSQTMRIVNYLFIAGSSLIILIYVVIFPNIILSKATIKLSSSNNELTAARSYGELFYNGKLKKGYKTLVYEWYHDAQRIGNGEIKNKGMEEQLQVRDSKGTFQVFLSIPNCEKCENIKSNIIHL